MSNSNLDNRRFVIGGLAVAVVVIYIIRLFTLQILSDDYKKNADSNAFLKKIQYPSRGLITDRNGKLSEESEKKAETFQNKHISYGDDER